MFGRTMRRRFLKRKGFGRKSNEAALVGALKLDQIICRVAVRRQLRDAVIMLFYDRIDIQFQLMKSFHIAEF